RERSATRRQPLHAAEDDLSPRHRLKELAGVDREDIARTRAIDRPTRTAAGEGRIETKSNATRIDTRGDHARAPRFAAARENNLAPLDSRGGLFPGDGPDARSVRRLPMRRRGPRVPPLGPRRSTLYGER